MATEDELKATIPITPQASASQADRLVMCWGAWQETTTRAKSKKVCRDMFITEYHGTFTLGITKNSRLVEKLQITQKEKELMVVHYGLEPLQNDVFRHAKTYRTPQSNNLVKWLLAT